MEESVEREEQESRLVCVVDDDLAILASSCALLESAGFRPVPYPSGAMLLDDDKYLHAGCIVLDLRMPPPDGIETLRRIRKSHQTVPVIMITGEGDIPTAVEAMKLGALDFEEKPIDDNVLIDLVERACSFSEGDASEAMVLTDDKSSRLDQLTEREQEVLGALLDGGTNKEIARRLDISHRTVEVHRANIMEKTGAASFSQLILMAAKFGSTASLVPVRRSSSLCAGLIS